MTQAPLSPELRDFTEHTLAEADRAFRVFRETGTITAYGTVNFIERAPVDNALIWINHPDPFSRDEPLKADVFTLDGTVLQGRGLGATRFLSVFNAHPAITTLSHVHTPSLGAWAQTHRSLPLTYVPMQRFQLARELPIYIDRRQAEDAFILEVLEKDPRIPAILEANGGATAWGWTGLRALAEFVLLLEEGADIAIRSEAIGGPRAFGPGVLRQQWQMSKLYDVALAEGLVPATDR